MDAQIDGEITEETFDFCLLLVLIDLKMKLINEGCNLSTASFMTCECQVSQD